MRTVFTFLFIFIICFSKPVKSSAQVIAQDSLALIDLYNSTNGASAWFSNSGWLGGGPVSSWYGISVTGNRVSDIDLDANDLSGTIPSSLGNLTGLSSLVLSNNQLNGNIPSSLGSLTNLTVLELTNNQLSGSIPATLGNLSKVFYFDLSYNQLTGIIPPSFGGLTSVSTLFLFNNQLSGNIPGSLGKLPVLSDLELNSNQLSGAIPDSLHYLALLNYLDISSNQLTGTIPTSFNSLVNLNTLNLYNNELTGTIPASLGSLAHLDFLNLSSNQLSGTIPNSINSLSTLQGVNFSDNQLTGSIPAALGKANMFFVDLSFNQLSGTVPSSFASLTSAFTFINDNKLTFDGMEQLFPSLAGVIIDSPQALIPLNLNASKFSVSAGGTLANDTFRWYRNGALEATIIGDSTYSPVATGYYSVSVSNKTVTSITGLQIKSDSVLFGLILPISFLNFTGTLVSSDALLKWQTITEINTAYFNVQRSTDAVNYTTIGKVTATYNSDATQTYHYTDDLSTLLNRPATLYYRLQAINENGNSFYSNIVPIQLSQVSSFTIYPNPVKDILHINTTNNSGNAAVLIFDANGNKILMQQQTLTPNSTININAAALAQGVYFLQLIINGSTVQKEFIKQ